MYENLEKNLYDLYDVLKIYYKEKKEMNLLIYSVFDKRAEIFAQPFLSHNDSTAVRQFNFMMSEAVMIAKDSALYCLGVFDTANGTITLNENKVPRFVCNFGEVNTNE